MPDSVADSVANSIFGFQIILVGILISSLCALLGVYLVLRRSTMVADAVSHSVLPGIVLAFLVVGTRSGPAMYLGSAIAGVLSIFLISFLKNKAKLTEEAALSLTFTTFFATGVLLISVFASKVDLDQDCVLFGELAYVPLRTWSMGDLNMGPISAYELGFALVLVLSFLYFLRNGLTITTFDPGFAASVGINTALIDRIFLFLVAVAVVVAFEIVGAILVLALLTIPALTALHISQKLRNCFGLSVIFGCWAVLAGYAFAFWLNVSLAGSISTVAGLTYGATIVLKR